MSWYPRWFPYPRAWSKAVALYIPAYLGVVVFPIVVWIFTPIVLFLAVAMPLEPRIWALVLFFASILIAGWLWFGAILVIYRALLAVLWSNPPSVITPKMGFKDVIRNYIIISISSIPTALLMLLLLASDAYNQSYWYVSTNNPISQYLARLIYGLPANDTAEVIVNLSWTWLIVAAYLIHVQQLKRQNKKG
jgi:hypothetical protein